ncbi:dethiobiotin synthase [Thiocystis violacea]|uniref:dethiobiotin synthase n=1 Tax=Thiocystis violacea TaxID=13725 RepID=UPI001907CAFB|nr:dethiobiotin synthase [Thiocystis violacea]MBK1719730.1 dethiobiotin synthase [Thiocystis violacea]
MSGLFVTGTDTGCGKTEISLGLMAALQARGLRVLAMKPVASGAVPGPEGPRNADALRLQAQGSTQAPYHLVNPHAFEPPIAPHLAAEAAGVAISLSGIRDAYQALGREADLVVVEGVGGWRVPLGPNLFLGDIPRALGLPVILVVGLKLGCLNHALLTVESLRANGVRLAGWVGNQVEPDMPALAGNLATLNALIEAPSLGVIPWLATPDPRTIARHLHLDRLDPETTPAWPARDSGL